MVAVRRGFSQGKLIEPGQEFAHAGEAAEFGDTDPWAVPLGTPVTLVPDKPIGGDTKPAAARAAVKAKAEGAQGPI